MREERRASRNKGLYVIDGEQLRTHWKERIIKTNKMCQLGKLTEKKRAGRAKRKW